MNAVSVKIAGNRKWSRILTSCINQHISPKEVDKIKAKVVKAESDLILNGVVIQNQERSKG